MDIYYISMGMCAFSLQKYQLIAINYGYFRRWKRSRWEEK